VDLFQLHSPFWPKHPVAPLTADSQIETSKNFFRVQSTRLADAFEPLNSSLAQSAEELGRW